MKESDAQITDSSSHVGEEQDPSTDVNDSSLPTATPKEDASAEQLLHEGTI